MGYAYQVFVPFYFILLVLEFMGTSLLSSQLINLEIDKKRALVAATILAGITLILDIFVYDFHKNAYRSLTGFILMFMMFRSLSKIANWKVFVQLTISAITLLMFDFTVQLILPLINPNIYSNEHIFTYMYSSLLIILYVVTFVSKKFNLTIIKLA